MRHCLFLATPTFSTCAIEILAVPLSIREQRHVGRRQECLDVWRMREQARACAAALSEMRAADATDPANSTVRRIARAVYV
jgi:hypothetical protein